MNHGTDHFPFSLYVLKVASRCNLNCKYCYMYNLGDLSYRNQPKVMSDDVLSALLTKIALHSKRHGVKEVVLVLHGGEPLLAGKEFFRKFVLLAKSILLPDVTPSICMQTNGTLLSPEWIELLSELEVGYGISLDGPEQINDENRIDHAGRGSYQSVKAAIELSLSSEKGRNLFGSVLTVINLASDPRELYQHFKQLRLRGADFLLPDGNHDQLPAGLGSGMVSTPYADWLIAIFDEWFDSQDKDFEIRFFDNIMSLVLGSRVSTDNIGGKPNEVLVIETDGGLEPVDVLKSCGHEFTKLNLNVLSNEIDDVYRYEVINKYQAGAKYLCQTCQACPIMAVCGGGYIPHRYRSANGFDNPSIYCADLAKLITHVQARLVSALPQKVRNQYALKTLTYEEVMEHVAAYLPQQADTGQEQSRQLIPQHRLLKNIKAELS